MKYLKFFFKNFPFILIGDLKFQFNNKKPIQKWQSKFKTFNFEKIETSSLLVHGASINSNLTTALINSQNVFRPEPTCCQGKNPCELLRFSDIETEKGAPYYTLYHPQVDPISKNEQPKRKNIKEDKKSKSDKSYKCDTRATTKKEKKGKKKKKVCPLEDAIDKSGKYKPPKPLKWLMQDDQRHKEERTKFFICPKVLVRVPSPTLIIGKDARNKVSKINNY